MKAVFLATAVWFVAAHAAAQDGDGLYGRFDNDTSISIAAGVADTTSNLRGDVAFMVEARAHYLESAGIFLGATVGDPERRYFAGVDVRPVFLGRFLTGRTLGFAFWDLLLDSIGVELGVSTFSNALGSNARAALLVGTGVDVPILWGGAQRLSWRLALRYARADVGTEPVATLWLSTSVVFSWGFSTGLATREPHRSGMR